MLQMFHLIQRVAPHFKTALITGETGSGKELVARALHRLSPSASGRFVACNCSAIVESLFESELFGHVKGAFTGAGHDRPGFFEYADSGTLFLDEIGDMPLSAQSKLLRALERREFQRVGSPSIRRTNARVVAATNRDLREMIQQKLFREDLFYRLSMIELTVPRLADRKDDLPLLQRHFLEKFSSQYGKRLQGITPRAQMALARYSWPGNVRELENVLGHACMMTQKELIDIHDVPEYIWSREHKEPIWNREELLPMSEIHKRYARHVLQHSDGNKAQAARILGINRATLYRLLNDAQENSGEKPE
jgi:DNA-binding NtrC family response regulator